VKFSGLVVLVFVLFFSISSTKLPNYPMPCYPFAAVVLGSFIASLLNNKINSKRYPYYFLLVFTLIIPLAGYFAIGQEAEAKDINYVTLLLLVTPLILLVAMVVGTTWQTRMGIIFIGYCIFNLAGLGYVYPVLYSQNPVSKTIEMVKQHPNIYAYNTFNPGYRFYLDKNVPTTNNIDTLKHWLDSSGSAIVISRTYYLDTLKPLPLQEIARHHDIFELPTTVIFKSTNEKP
jgi:hypothetical protein